MRGVDIKKKRAREGWGKEMGWGREDGWREKKGRTEGRTAFRGQARCVRVRTALCRCNGCGGASLEWVLEGNANVDAGV